MKFDNKLIVSDLDGTFFDSETGIVRVNVDAINYFKENGGFFTFATGRNELTLEPDVIKLVNAPIICCNGSYLYDPESNRRLREICIAPGPIISMIKTVLASFDDIGIRVTADNKYYVIGDSIEYNLDRISANPELFVSTDINNLPTYDWHKVVFVGDKEKLDLAYKFIKVKAEGLYQLARSSPNQLEMFNLKATKGIGAVEVKNMLEAKHGPICMYGIGDYENDIELLKNSDVAACPDNSLDEVKLYSDVIVCSNDNGAVAGLIEYIDSTI